MDKADELKGLLERYRNIVDSDKNKERGRLWTPTPDVVKEKFRGQPKPYAHIGKIPMLAWPETRMWADLLNFTMDEYYKKPVVYLENLLKSRIYYFENFNDDNYMEEMLPIYLGEGFEASFFGIGQEYSPYKDPWPVDCPVIINEEDLESYRYNNTFNNGLMGLARQFYETISEIAAPWGLRAGFPNWYHSPFHMVIFVHGLENTFLDLVYKPDFIESLLGYMTESEIDWSKKRAEYLGINDVPLPILADDYISLPNISPKMYKDHILPFEKHLSERMGGIAYWHDCGDAGPYMEYVKEIPDIKMVHSGPYTKFKKVAENFSGIPVEVHLNPVSDYMEANCENMRQSIENIIKTAQFHNVSAYTVRITCYRRSGSGIEKDIEKIREWTETSQSLAFV
ncbi:MAG: hypothetical protein FIA99_05155 [Ruminiclostridium sp.]|nr:hypothetical protein [Ruminiclostridium sp.]